MITLNLFIYIILFLLIVDGLNGKTHVSYESKDKNENWPDPSKFVPGLAGGISVASEEKFTQAKQLLEKLNIKVLEIENLYSQVVAGFLYYIEGLFNFPNESKPFRCRLKVLWQQWLVPPIKITYKQCDIKPHISESIISGQTKRIDLNDYDEVINALQLLSSTGIKLENKINIKSISKQVVSGIKYTFDSVFKNNKGKTQSCVIEIVNRPWDKTQKHKIIKNTCLDEFKYTDDSIVQLNVDDTNAMNAFYKIQADLDVINLEEVTKVFRQILNDGEIRYIIEGIFETNKKCWIGISKQKRKHTILSQSCNNQ